MPTKWIFSEYCLYCIFLSYYVVQDYLDLDNDGFLKEKLKDVPKVYDFIFQELLVAKR